MAKLSSRMWACIVLIGLVGQFAWTIENMYFNVFLYNTISTDPRYISQMVAWSAAAATLTTLLMGALSDRVGKRKLFICAGYILWGISTAAFGLITVENAAKLFPAQAVSAAATMVVILDCVMTFFGSTANDAAFNAYITDCVPSQARGRTEAVLAVLPLLSMLMIFGLFDAMTQRGEWQRFFAIFGGLVTAVGFAAIFLIKEPPLQPRRDSYIKNLLYGLRFFDVWIELDTLYSAFVAFSCFSISVQVFFPYLIIYMQNYLQLDNYAIILGVVLLTASGVSVLFGRVIDRVGKLRIVLPAMAVMLAGLVGMFFARTTLPVIIAGCVMMSGYMLSSAALSGVIRDETPRDRVGMFQGTRIIFSVLIPMLIGPAIGARVILNSDSTYEELGVVKSVPTPEIFLAAAVVLAFAMLYSISLIRKAKREEKL